MLKAGGVEPAKYNYNLPIVLVNKKDKINRIYIDYRRINSIKRFDTEPMDDTEDIMISLSNYKYF